jgi:two-component system sensor histidine kinase MprB
MSLRTRLGLASAVAVAVAVALATGATYLIVRGELRGQVDDALRGRADVAGHMGRGPGMMGGFGRGGLDLPTPALGGAAGYLQLVSADGTTSRGAGQDVALPITSRTLAVAAGSGNGFLADATVAGTHIRMLTVPLTTGLALQIARPLTEVDSVLDRLRLILALVGAGGIGLAALLGFGVARTALVPVRRLTETAEHITVTHDLTRRVEPVQGDELGRLAASFNTMLDELEGSLKAQRQLVADASHELRTPLTSLRTNVELLGRGGLKAKERAAVLGEVSAQIEELTALVADVVELSRDGESEHALEDVRLDLLVRDAVERAQRHTPLLRFETELEETIVRGAPERLHRAVANLLDNAAKWSPPDGVVEVVVRGGEVGVRDHGPGIAPEDLPHVFDRFYRAAAARALPGSGLGLAIVRQVAEAHGGSATAEPAEGGGSIFRLRLSAMS